MRFKTRIGWLDSKHSFSFSNHWDPDNTNHGLLMVSNDDIVQPGAGFETHPHKDMEIVTWVLQGSLVHHDSEGNTGVLYPGLAQRMSAGSGILHSEKNDSWRTQGGPSHEEPVRFIQMWVPPDTRNIEPSYEQHELDDDLLRNGLATVASGMKKHAGDAAIRIKNRHAALYASRLDAGSSITVPEAPFVHLFVARGAVQMEGAGHLAEGDAVRLTTSGGQTITADDDAEVLIWEMHATIG